jgi:hypothetical protein
LLLFYQNKPLLIVYLTNISIKAAKLALMNKDGVNLLELNYMPLAIHASHAQLMEHALEINLVTKMLIATT